VILSKINGILFSNETITTQGENDILQLANKFCEKGITMLANPDTFSLTAMQMYIQKDSQEAIPLVNQQSSELKEKYEDMNRNESVHCKQQQKSRISSRTQPIIPTTQTNRRKGDILTTRVELRLQMFATAQEQGDVNQLQRQLQELVNKLVESDASVKFHPWYDNDEAQTLDNNKVPDDFRTIHRYFPRLQLMKNGTTYGEFKISHKRRWEDIICDLTPWLSNHKHGMYYQVLQCPLTTNIGWLLWSFRRIDIEKLQQEIEELYDVKVNLRYQNISIGQGKTAPNNMVRALHVVCDQNQTDKISNLFQQIYSFNSDNFPLGIVMRFIPHILRVTNSKHPKIIKCRARQNAFLKTIEDPNKTMTATSWEIMLLDTSIKDFGTLRKNLMSIKTKSNKNEYLFLSVDVSFFRSNEVLFSFLPRHEQEARSFVANIVPYYRDKYHINQIKDIFYQEALELADQSVWNADTEEVVSPADLYIEQRGEILDDFDFLEAIRGEGMQSQNESTIQEIHRVERLFTGEDATSVETLFTQENQSRIDNRKKVIEEERENTLLGTNNNSHQESCAARTIVSTTKSVSTAITIEELDLNMTKLSNEMSEIKSMLKDILHSQQEATNQTNNMTITYENTNMEAGVSEEQSTCRNK
jgi:hypothetical protein